MASGGASGVNTPSDNSLPLPDVLNSATPPTVICVFCGSLPGKSPAHMAAARSLGQLMASRNIHLVYGGGTSGLMGEVARTVVSLSGPDSVHGIIPAPLMKYEQPAESTTTTTAPTSEGSSERLLVPDPAVYGRTTIVSGMHQRKRLMARCVVAGGPGSGFVALSGGIGTLEELFETGTWNQLGLHKRGVVMYNVEGFMDHIKAHLENLVAEGFVREASKTIIGEGSTAEECVEYLASYQAPERGMDLEWESL